MTTSGSSYDDPGRVIRNIDPELRLRREILSTQEEKLGQKLEEGISKAFRPIRALLTYEPGQEQDNPLGYRVEEIEEGREDASRVLRAIEEVNDQFEEAYPKPLPEIPSEAREPLVVVPVVPAESATGVSAETPREVLKRQKLEKKRARQIKARQEAERIRQERRQQISDLRPNIESLRNYYLRSKSRAKEASLANTLRGKGLKYQRGLTYEQNVENLLKKSHKKYFTLLAEEERDREDEMDLKHADESRGPTQDPLPRPTQDRGNAGPLRVSTSPTPLATTTSPDATPLLNRVPRGGIFDLPRSFQNLLSPHGRAGIDLTRTIPLIPTTSLDISQRVPEIPPLSLDVGVTDVHGERPDETPTDEQRQRMNDALLGNQQVGEPLSGEGRGSSRGLYSNEIDEILSHHKDYLGTISRDGLKSILPKIKPGSRGGVVLNLDPARKAGSHWTSLFWDSRPEGSRTIEYYNSYGEPMPADLRRQIPEIIQRLKPTTYLKFKENSIINQRSNSSNCGYFSAKFLIDRFRGIPFPECSGFSNVVKSEKDIERFKKSLPPFQEYV